MSNPLHIALVGFGNIGTGVVRHLQQFGPMMNARLPRPIELKTICDIDIKRDRGVSTDGYALTDCFDDVLRDPEIEVVIELIGGTRIAREVVTKALSAGKHVVTANKALLGAFGGELFEIARQHNVQLLFEASVGAGIPFIRAMQTGLLPDRIKSLHGIVNGTCNFILTAMEDQPGVQFDGILQEAMRLGYAEPDPTLDIEGLDAAHKLAVLGSLAFQLDLHLDDIAVMGITRISQEDFAFARGKGQTIKLLACAEANPAGGPHLSVWPSFVPQSHLVGRVRGVTNTLMIDAEPIGPTIYTGAGAGQGSTSSGILSDICLVAQAGGREALRRLNPLTIPAQERSSVKANRRHPRRYIRIDAPEAAAAGNRLGLTVLGQAGRSVSFIAPEQADEQRSEMYEKLLSMGIDGGSVSEIRVALQPVNEVLSR